MTPAGTEATPDLREREERQSGIDIAAEKGATNLSHDEKVEIEERRAPSAIIVHEVIRLQGIEELERRTISLIWSGLAAGVAMGMSVLSQAILSQFLPAGPGGEAVAKLGYTTGFLIVIMGRMQLFTESTVTAVLPLATQPCWRSLRRTLRLWAIVFAANLVGTFAFALYARLGGFGSPQLTAAIVEVARQAMTHGPAHSFWTGISSGFVIATIVWLMPSSSGQRIWIIIALTWLIALGGFAHVVVGSGEAWLMLLTGQMSGGAVAAYILATLAGNIVGGSALFAVLAHGQVHHEITRASDESR